MPEPGGRPGACGPPGLGGSEAWSAPDSSPLDFWSTQALTNPMSNNNIIRGKNYIYMYILSNPASKSIMSKIKHICLKFRGDFRNRMNQSVNSYI